MLLRMKFWTHIDFLICLICLGFVKNGIRTLPTRTVLTIDRCFFCSYNCTSGWTLNPKEEGTKILDKSTSKYTGVLQPKPIHVRLPSPLQEIKWFLQGATWRLPDWSEHPAYSKDLGVVHHNLYWKLICGKLGILIFNFFKKTITSS